ncbi:PREDICTED: protein ripply1 [Chinchilla lanigera]|uniref:protein ripply1 n=1 Tax=Chinchilla lanigera TaxID=34839 RepID=UPI00038F0873|nr:PREDICTED: protein ripply1 [Chinchilla lanigera]
MSSGRAYKRVSGGKTERILKVLRGRRVHSFPGLHDLRMDLVIPTVAAPGPALAPALALTQPPGPQVLPGLLHPPPLVSSGQELPGIRRGASLWRPWTSSVDDPPKQVRKLVDWPAGGRVAGRATKAASEFHHPVRLFWPRSCSFDYLYSAGEILLQSFPVQATINLYEDSDSEEEEEEGEDDEEKEEANEKGSEGHVKEPGSMPHRIIAHLPSPIPVLSKLK